jgi:hypothetical protein
MTGATRPFYRAQQFFRAVGAALIPLNSGAVAEARAALPATAWPLFAAMPRADQRHGLGVWRTLRARGHGAPALTQAALLHDCAKHQGSITLAHRVAVVLLRAFRPSLLAGWAAWPAPGPGGWRQPFWAHAHHPDTGALLAASAGCDPLAVELIRRHQEPSAHRPDDDAVSPLLAALQAADNDN